MTTPLSDSLDHEGRAMHEVIKIVGGVAWLAGLILLFVAPILGIPILLVALVLSIRSVSMTKERRHQELLNAQKRE